MKTIIFCQPNTKVLEKEINNFLSSNTNIKIIHQQFTTEKYYSRDIINRCPFCGITTNKNKCPKCKSEYLESIEISKPKGIFYIKEIMYEEM